MGTTIGVIRGDTRSLDYSYKFVKPRVRPGPSQLSGTFLRFFGTSYHSRLLHYYYRSRIGYHTISV